MAKKVERFEELIAWQKARVLTREVRRLTKQRPISQDFSLCDQMRRSARSIMANIAEGFDRGSRPEFHKSVVFAKGSCAELRSDFYTALDDSLVSRQEFDRFLSLCEEQSRILAGLRRALARPKS